MLTELVRAPETLPSPSSWATKKEKRIVVFFVPSGIQAHMTMAGLVAAAALAVPGTSTGSSYPVLDLERVVSASFADENSTKKRGMVTVPAMLKTIRSTTALTWEQLATIFDVSRRAVHHWASGATVALENQQKVRGLFDQTEQYADLEVFEARARVLNEYGISSGATNSQIRSEPILSADQSPLTMERIVRRTPLTRVRRG